MALRTGTLSQKRHGNKMCKCKSDITKSIKDYWQVAFIVHRTFSGKDNIMEYDYLFDVWFGLNYSWGRSSSSEIDETNTRFTTIW